MNQETKQPSPHKGIHSMVVEYMEVEHIELTDVPEIETDDLTQDEIRQLKEGTHPLTSPVSLFY